MKSVVLLLTDTSAVNSYDTLIEKAASLLAEDGSLDILLTTRITHLNTLDSVLAATYTLCTGLLHRLEKTGVNVTVLFNDHFKETAQTWEACLIDPSDNNYGLFDYEDKQLLETVSIQRSSSTPQVIKDDHDISEESIHNVSAVGGTFDHFHDGHKMLLTASAFVTNTKLIVGVTDHELLKNKKYPELLQSYDYRVFVIKNFLGRIKPNLTIDPVPIHDVCGPTGTIADIDALIVSRETVKGAEFINKTRLERGFGELKVHVINVIGGEEDDGFENKLSSTQLRREKWEAIQKERKD
jgi:pantetheine-phosphate adenylyltransferase